MKCTPVNPLDTHARITPHQTDHPVDPGRDGSRIIWFAYGFFTAWNRFASEEWICGAFDPVISALDEFQQQSGSLPTNLTQLVPQYVPHLPRAPVAQSIEYRVLPDGTNWQLSVRSSVRGRPELFVQRSSRDFTADEQRQSVTRFHGWLVFRQP
jgi:hypothetical protein